MQNETTIPLVILTGYLGTGKTTLLNRILKADHKLRIAVLINDFGSTNLDSRLIVGRDNETMTLSNGCICCTIGDDIVGAISNIIKTDTPPDFIILESSGITDPARLVLTINRSYLRNHIRIDSIVVLVDAGQFLKPVDNSLKDLLHEQIRLSDSVIINKTDLVDAETLADVRDEIYKIIDKATVLEAQYCDVPISSLIDTASYNPQTAFNTGRHGVHAHSVDDLDKYKHNDRSLVFATWSWETDEQVILPEMRQVLDTLPNKIFRAKGILYTQEMPDRRIVLQLVGKRVTLTAGEPWGNTIPKNEIDLIGDIPAVDKDALKDAFEGTRVSAGMTGKAGTIFNGILEWIRPG